jgi:chromosome partitioning protein
MTATIISVTNQKGGVGKSTTAINLAAGIATHGYQVLLVDMDPQGNATSGLGVDRAALTESVYDVLLKDADIEDVIEPTSTLGLHVLPATIDLAAAEIELVSAMSREQRLNGALKEVAENYDFVIIDCPPSLGLLTINAFAASSELFIPIQCEYYALEGVSQLLSNIKLVQGALNPDLEVGGVILTMYDGRTKLSSDVAAQVREYFGDKALETVIPRSVKLSEAPSYGEPIESYSPMSSGGIAYRQLAKEFLKRHGLGGKK